MFRWLLGRKRREHAAAASTPALAETSKPEPAAACDPIDDTLQHARVGGAEEARAIWSATAKPRGGVDEEVCRSYLSELRRRRLREPAIAVAESLAAALPGQAWPLSELAKLHILGTDNVVKLAVGQRVVDAVPDSAEGAQLVIQGLLGQGRRDDAKRFFATLPASLAEQDWYLVIGLRFARQRDDTDQVLAYAAKLREVCPDRPLGYTAASTLLRQGGAFDQAEALMQSCVVACPDAADAWREAAIVAQAMDRDELAFERWAMLRTRCPTSPLGHVGAVQLSERLHQPAVTRQLVADGLLAFPGDPELLEAHAREASQSRQWDQASTRWNVVIEQKQDPAIRLKAAMALLGEGRERAKRIPEVMRLLEETSALFPDYVPTCIARMKLLREAGDTAAAAALGRSWADRFADSKPLAIARAKLAESLGQAAEAVACLEQARTAPPLSGVLEAAYVRALCVAGETARAEQACADALAALPADVSLLVEHTKMATRRGDWACALERAEQAVALRPGEAALRGMLQKLRVQVLLPGDHDVGIAARPADASAGSPPSGDDHAATPAFFLRFESLGATSAGCEFGIVQRRFGCEPLGLLRWARISVEGLIGALANRFEGVGEPANTQLHERDEGPDHKEYYITDSRLGFSTHTFVAVSDSPPDRMLKQSLRRMQFLRGKLLEDLEAADKVFVYKLAPRFAKAETLVRLHDALRRYGDITLLCVTLAREDALKGDLQMLRPGLFLGRTATFMGEGRQGGAGIDSEKWRVFCERVATWRDGHPVTRLETAVA